MTGAPVAGAPDTGLVQRLRDIVRGEADVPQEVPGGRHGDAEIAAALALILPDARARFDAAGLTDGEYEETIADVERKHRLYGAGQVLPWLLRLLRAEVVSVGRLQVERRAGEHGHALHVPETGPLDAGAVDDSLARARLLTGSERFCCTSWLLDPALPVALAGSRIAGFATRFSLIERREPTEEAARSVASFVFRRPLAEVRDPRVVVPRTRLERLVAERLRSGAGWSEPIGVLRRA